MYSLFSGGIGAPGGKGGKVGELGELGKVPQFICLSFFDVQPLMPLKM
jgi:hypothetical protein